MTVSVKVLAENGRKKRIFTGTKLPNFVMFASAAQLLQNQAFI